jgi:very-short-patch-repair endonuclease
MCATCYEFFGSVAGVVITRDFGDSQPWAGIPRSAQPGRPEPGSLAAISCHSDGFSLPVPVGDAPISELAATQHGVVATRQLLAIGYTEDMIRRRVEASRLHPVCAGVYSVGTKILSSNGHRMAAVLAYGDGALLSHSSGVALWGFRPRPLFPLHVMVPGTSRKSRQRIVVHRARSIGDSDRDVVDSIPVTSVVRTILDYAAGADVDQLLRAIEQADRQGQFNPLQLELAIEACRNRKGTRKLRRILKMYQAAPDSRSRLERLFLRIIRAAGLPEPQTNVLVAGVLVDFFWPEWGLVVEIDSLAFHANPRKFESDRAWDAILQRAGYRILRITEARLADPAGIIDDILALSRLPR